MRLRLRIKCGSRSEAPIHVGKLVVSVFPDQPEEGNITFDVEILRADNASVVVCSDFYAEHKELDTLPYDEDSSILKDYLTEEDYEQINDYEHIDSTGGARHLVLQGDSEMSSIQGVEEGFENQWRLHRGEDVDRIGEEIERSLASGTINCIRMLGDWFRLVGDWTGFRRDGFREEMRVSVETEEIICDGLYIWYFAPDPYTIVRSGSKVSVWHNEDPINEHLRISTESPSPDEFKEFSIWDGWIQNHDLVTNRDRIHWDSENRKSILDVALTSPELKKQERESSFWLGALIAITATGAIQMAIALAGPPGESLSAGWFWLAFAIFLGGLIICLNHKPSWWNYPWNG